MRNESGVWTAEIPGQGGGSIVTSWVTAEDNAGNLIATSRSKYTVFLLPVSPLVVALIAAVVVAAVGTVLYLVIKRRRNPKPQEKSALAKNEPKKIDKNPAEPQR